MKRAVVLLSGGLDSTTTLAICAREGFETYALSFDYGQRTNRNGRCRRIAAALGAHEHRVAEIDLRVFGGSALTDEIAVPKAQSEDEMKAGDSGDLRSGAQHDFSRLRARLGGGDPSAGHFYRRQCDRLQRLSGLPSGDTSPRLRNWRTWRQKREWKAPACASTLRLFRCRKRKSFDADWSSASTSRSLTAAMIRIQMESPAANAIPAS